jgi:hypothetical protein
VVLVWTLIPDSVRSRTRSGARCGSKIGIQAVHGHASMRPQHFAAEQLGARVSSASRVFNKVLRGGAEYHACLPGTASILLAR